MLWTTFALLPAGRWDEAAAILGRLQRRELSVLSRLLAETGLLFLDTSRGDFEAADRRAASVRVLAKDFPTELPSFVLADLSLWQGDPRRARDAIVQVLEIQASARENRVWIAGWSYGLGIRAEADLAADARARSADADVEKAEAIGADLLARMRAVFEEIAERRPYYLPQATAWLATCEAEFSRLEGDSDPQLWASAAAACGALGVPYDRAYALMREAEATLAQHRDRPRAAAALTTAGAIADRLGARPLRGAVESIAFRAGIALGPPRLEPRLETVSTGVPRSDGPSTAQRAPRSPAARRGRFDLTPRELEVLRLLAAGRTDGEIAERLFISRKTASVHVAAIKGKLGARSRIEIALDAIGLGLIDTPPNRPA